MALDVYVWLAYRLHALKRDTEVELDGALRSVRCWLQAIACLPGTVP